jgi:1-acyl-sn-glycerol-3-phosphate acyltransferase
VSTIVSGAVGAKSQQDTAPRGSWMLRWFIGYSRRYIAKNFDALRVQGWENAAVDPETPIVVYFNHSSWWDPLAALVLTNEFFPLRHFIGPIDAAMLERYGILRRLGCFFGVEQGTARGARQFLRAGTAALSRPGGALCVPPQGRFVDVRQRPAGLSPGLAHLLSRLPPQVQVIPLALEYVFWNERTSNILARFGTSFRGEAGWTVADWETALETRLVETQDALAAAASSRDPQNFRSVVSGRSGIGGIYDTFRRFVAKLRGKTFDARHGK